MNTKAELKVEYFNKAIEVVKRYQSDIVHDLEVIDGLANNDILIIALRETGTHCILINDIEANIKYFNAILNNFEVIEWLGVSNNIIVEFTEEEVLQKLKALKEV